VVAVIIRAAMNPTWAFVALIYALAVWLARRAGIDLRWRVASFFYLLVLVFFFKPMTQAYVDIPVDFLNMLSPWSHLTRDHRVGNPELNDLVLQIVPWAHQVRESWRALQFPLWNNFSGSGYPLLGNGQSSAFSPLRLLALPLPLGYSITAEAAMKILIALTFMYLLCRRRYSELASIVGAVAFAFCTFLNTWLHFPLITVSCFVPAVLYAVDLLVERRTYGRFLFAVALWATMLFGGHPETCSHAFFIASLYLIWILAVERPVDRREALRVVLTLGAVLFVAALIASPFLATFAEAVTKSKRMQELQVHPNVIGYYSDFPSTILLLQPHFFGHIPDQKPWGPATAESITGFAGVLGIAAWIALLIRAIATRRFRDREFFWVVVTPIILGIILAWPVVSTVFHLIFKMAANARLRLLLCLALAMQSAAVIDLLLRERLRSLYAGLAVVAAVMVYLIATQPFPTDALRDAAMLSLAPSALVLAIAAILVALEKSRAHGMAILAVAIIAELWIADAGWNRVVTASMMYPKTPLLEKLTSLRGHEPFRIVGAGPVFFPNVAAVYGLEDIRAHDPMANGRYLGTLRVTGNYETDDYFAKWNDFDARVLDFLNVKYVITTPTGDMKDMQRFARIYAGADGQIFENRDVQPRFHPADVVILEFKGDYFMQRLVGLDDWAHSVVVKRLPVASDQERNDLLAPRPANSPRATVTLTRWTPTDFRMRIHAPRWTMIASAQPWWPGWKVTYAGRKLEPLQVNGAFLGFVVPPGDAEVRVHYAPIGFYAGLVVSLFTLVALAIGGAAARRKQRRA
jgi:hypothetical protein